MNQNMHSETNLGVDDIKEYWLICGGKLYDAKPYMSNVCNFSKQKQIDESWLIFDGKVYDAIPCINKYGTSTRQEVIKTEDISNAWYICGGEVHDATPYIDANLISLPSEMSQHTETKDCWLVCNGQAFDATPYIEANIITLPSIEHNGKNLQTGKGDFSTAVSIKSTTRCIRRATSQSFMIPISDHPTRSTSKMASTLLRKTNSQGSLYKLGSSPLRRTNSQGSMYKPGSSPVHSLLGSSPVQASGITVRRC
eukprot:CAMPEP_0113952456 /NCGR_PEP_ID=MMETSP1339-20121228/90430_1 /TAXON_ID=94617 /ORGANISM="Fibrocapsa japonica" /LENGTH=252 /DNA_ID=CAMNT_0000961073 /DNA_START=93 /DNA_END=851 /DNA_ORIENTATION=+ /assembly_acc=CAM_ASM_000762